MSANPPEAFTVKEFLQNVVLPKLDGIEKKLDGKVDGSEFRTLTARVSALEPIPPELKTTVQRVEAIEKKFSTPDQILTMIEGALEKSKARGWSVRERSLQALLVIVTLTSLLFNLLVGTGH